MKIGDETVVEVVESRFAEVKVDETMKERMTVGSVHTRPVGACR